MSGKHDRALRLDRRVEANFANGDLPTADFTVEDLAPPAPPEIPAPRNLQLAAYLTRSAQAGMAMITATWDMITHGTEADAFNIAVSTDSSFPDGSTQTYVALNESAALENLHTATTYYVRVQAVYRAIVGAWSATASILTPTDTTPPDPVTAVVWTWFANGDLQVRWTMPTSENYKEAEVRIYNNGTKTLHYQTLLGRNNVVWTAAMNRVATSGVPVNSVYIEVWAKSWNNVYSVTYAVPASQPTKAVPATPTGLATSWTGDAGLAGADCDITWNGQPDANKFRLTIDGTAREMFATSYFYGLSTNKDEHANVGDPSLSLSLIAIDGLDQVSVAATLIAINLAPPTTSILIAPAVSTVGIFLTASQAADWSHFSLRVVKDGSTVATFRETSGTSIYDVGVFGRGSYQVGVSVIDVFNQASVETLSLAVLLDPLTIAELRLDATYEDSRGTATVTLDTLKDAILGSGGVTYL
jgi:hypothetical protein